VDQRTVADVVGATPQHPTRQRGAVAPISGAFHTVRCLRFSAVQAAMAPVGIAPRGGKPQRQHE
jgi:hypothetical protein